MPGIGGLRGFVTELTRLVERVEDEAGVLEAAGGLLRDLVARDDWLPDAFAKPHPDVYQQYLLHCDPLERFSVVSFVWGPGQGTPVHDHMVWGLIGMLRGEEACRDFAVPAGEADMEITSESRLHPGDVAAVSPRIGDIHQVFNGLSEAPSISIHVYGANIGAVNRHIYDCATGRTQPFVSGYVNETTPNLWDRSAEVRKATAE